MMNNNVVTVEYEPKDYISGGVESSRIMRAFGPDYLFVSDDQADTEGFRKLILKSKKSDLVLDEDKVRKAISENGVKIKSLDSGGI